MTATKSTFELEPGDIFLGANGQAWTVVENLPSVNKSGSNVTVTSTERGFNQRGSFSFNGQTVDLVCTCGADADIYADDNDHALDCPQATGGTT